MGKRKSKRVSTPAPKRRGQSRLVIYVVAVAAVAILALALTLMRSGPESQSSPATATSNAAVRAGYEVVASYPHDPDAYTQGLLWFDGGFYESTGLFGHSTLRRVEFPSGKVLKSFSLAPDIFGEGLALANDRLIQLTWQSHRGFVYERESFKLLREFSYATEGWGITFDGKSLIMSDGSSTLMFLDPESFQATRRLNVTMNGAPVQELNELEFIDGEIWSNVWLTDRIVRIDPATGHVTSYLDMTGLLPEAQRRDSDDVLNGIAYDPDAKRIFVGGKRWPKLFEIKLK